MKYRVVLQHSEEDCGAACLATISKHYGKTFTMSRIREAVGTGSRGTSLLGLGRGAESLGFNTRQVKASRQLLNQLKRIPLPSIIHWKGSHWVVLYGKKRKKFVISDPAFGIRFLTEKELMEGWSNGAMLLLTPDEIRFYEQPDDHPNKFGRYIKRAWPYRWILAQAIAINFVVGLLSLASPLMMQLLTDDVLVRGDTQLLTTVAIGVIVLNFVQSIINLVQSHLVGHFGQRLQLGLIFEYGRKLLHLPLAYFESRRTGEVVSRIADVTTINTIVSQLVLGLPSQFFIAIVSLCLMLVYSWQLTIASIAGFVLVALINILFLPILREKTRKMIVLSTENQGFLVETFRGVQILKTTQATSPVWQEYQGNYGRLANLSWSTMKLSLYSGTFTSIVSTLTSIGLLWIGSYLVIQQTLSLGQLLAFHGMSGNFLGFLGSVIGLVDEFITVQVVINRLNEVIDTPSEDGNDEKKPWVELSDQADIHCTEIDFHHPGRVDLLHDFTLTMPGGKVVALIGASGCGKSTLAKVLTGLYPIQSGNISYGIYHQRDLAFECLRQQVALVPQDSHFWSRSILDNFLLSCPRATFEEVINACQIVGADDFIGQLPDKYQTILGEFGANLSGGQKQRLAIARAIINNPPVLILDESTSALDPVSESQLLEQLLTSRCKKTTIIISHRPKVISRAQWIVMLEKGKVKIQGSLADLLEQEGDHQEFLDPSFLVTLNKRCLKDQNATHTLVNLE